MPRSVRSRDWVVEVPSFSTGKWFRSRIYEFPVDKWRAKAWRVHLSPYKSWDSCCSILGLSRIWGCNSVLRSFLAPCFFSMLWTRRRFLQKNGYLIYTFLILRNLVHPATNEHAAVHISSFEIRLTRSGISWKRLRLHFLRVKVKKKKKKTIRGRMNRNKWSWEFFEGFVLLRNGRGPQSCPRSVDPEYLCPWIAADIRVCNAFPKPLLGRAD